MTRRRFLLATMLAGAGGCATAPPRALAWRTLAKGLQSGIKDSRRRVFREDVAWYEFWVEHAAALGRPAPPPAVDFAREMVAVVTRGTRRSGGHVVSIVNAEAGRHRLRLYVEEIDPKPGVLVTMGETQPYHFVALPRSDATVLFTRLRRAK